MALIGYMRVSKADGSQVLDMQRDALITAGVDADAIYEDMASGKKDDRPGLAACLKALRKSDILVCWKLDRIGRSLHHLVNTLHGLNERGVGLKVLTGAPIDTGTNEGKLMFSLFAGLAEFERDLVAERTHAGLAAARARGRKGGRPAAMTRAKVLRAQAAMKDRQTDVSVLATELGVTRQTIYRHVGPGGELREDGKRALERRARR